MVFSLGNYTSSDKHQLRHTVVILGRSFKGQSDHLPVDMCKCICSAQHTKYDDAMMCGGTISERSEATRIISF